MLVLIQFLLLCVCAAEELRFSEPQSLLSLFPDGVQNIKPALFGSIAQNQRQVTGRILNAMSAQYGCSINASLINPAHSAVNNDPVIVMVHVGTCSFASLVNAVQRFGGSAAIVVYFEGENLLPSMHDDGTGSSVTIPSVLISDDDATLIKRSCDNDTVTGTIKWQFPSVVTWKLWLVMNQTDLRLFEKLSNALGNSSLFELHYIINNGSWYYCTDSNGTACGSWCTNSGRYCSVDPDGNRDMGVSAGDAVRENLRQICVWRECQSENETSKWWQYIDGFQQACIDSGNVSSQCSYQIQSDLDMHTDLVASCIAASGGYEDNGGENSILNEEVTLRSKLTTIPAMMIDDQWYYGSMDCPEPVHRSTCGVLDTICSSYPHQTIPDACTGDQGCPLGQKRDVCGRCGGDGTLDACGHCLSQGDPDRQQDASSCSKRGSAGMSVGSIVGIVVGTLIVASGAFILIHRRMAANMRRQFADILKQYAPLGNRDSEGMSTVMDSTAPAKEASMDSLRQLGQ
eukprot:TRINITY_DN18194_c0_g1_i1.p1 TRINITY_DN18194_c0_g1~~TRINITY_DN18194_c0_g1_i1.p1  ORF type:complete len:515 (-),score=97.67 TRINITY_DN18194_c0_g1_i1:70-1614(-)